MLKTNDLYLQKLNTEVQRPEEGQIKRAVTTAGSRGILNSDLLTGMRQSIRNSQQRLALEYVAELLEVQAAQIEELQARFETTDPSPEEPEAVQPRPRKVVSASNRRTKVVPAQEPDEPVEEEPAA